MSHKKWRQFISPSLSWLSWREEIRITPRELRYGWNKVELIYHPAQTGSPPMPSLPKLTHTSTHKTLLCPPPHQQTHHYFWSTTGICHHLPLSVLSSLVTNPYTATEGRHSQVTSSFHTHSPVLHVLDVFCVKAHPKLHSLTSLTFSHSSSCDHVPLQLFILMLSLLTISARTTQT